MRDMETEQRKCGIKTDLTTNNDNRQCSRDEATTHGGVVLAFINNPYYKRIRWTRCSRA